MACTQQIVLRSVFVLGLAAFLVSVADNASPYKRVCYFYKPLAVETMNFTVCTHIIYYGVSFNETNGTFYFPSDVVPYIDGLQKAREQYGFKLLVTFAHQLDLICGSENNMTKFANTAVSYLPKAKLDGIDFDWEFPGWKYKERFGEFLRVLRRVFDSNRADDESPLLISTAVTAFSLQTLWSYDIPAFTGSLDILDIMGYDLRAFSMGYIVTGHHAPLYASKDDFSLLKTMNLNWSANYFASQGFPKERIVLGLPAYARGWELLTPSIHGLYAPAVGEPVPSTLNFSDICELLQAKGTGRGWDSYAKGSYAYNDKRWYSYNFFQDIKDKVEYMMKYGFGGTMVWALIGDTDFDNKCGTGYDFPVHSFITDLILNK